MFTLKDYIEEKLRYKYRKKLEKFKISPLMINVSVNEHGIKPIEIIKYSDTKQELNDYFLKKMIYRMKGEFYETTILMGFHFGVYNVYCPFEISYDLVNESINNNPSVRKSKIILNDYREQIIEFLKEKYKIEAEKIIDIINKLFTIQYDYELYNSYIVQDIQKILLAIEIRYDDEMIYNKNNKIKDSIKSSEILEYFDKINMDIKNKDRLSKKTI